MVDSSLLQEVAWGRVSFPSLDWDVLYLLGSPFAYGMLCSFLSWTWGGNHGSVARRENLYPPFPLWPQPSQAALRRCTLKLFIKPSWDLLLGEQRKHNEL